MKKRTLPILSLLALLCSCGPTESKLVPPTPAPSESTESDSSSVSEFSSATTSQKETVDGVYQFYCVNDFHGSVMEQYNGKYYESGVAKYFGKLKELKAQDPDHTFIFSAGDMFQGSLESNDNHGHLVMDCMNETGFDAMTLGNHEFDYGPDRLMDIVSWADFPILGGNVMVYDKGPTSTPWKDGAFPISTTIERGGNKLGVVGMIGYGQTSSITSKFVEDVYFENPYQICRKEATRLKEEEDCDMVIFILHDDMTACQDYATKEYFDGVFTGHKHTRNNSVYGGVPFVQSYCNGEAISHFELTIKDGNVTCTGHENIWANESWTEDETLAQIRDSYVKAPEFAQKANADAGHVNGTLGAKEGVSNLVAKAIYEKYKPLHPNIVGAMQNGLRAPLSGDISYRDIYKAAPFTNHVVIAKVSGNEILNEGAMNSFYRADMASFEVDEFYEIACIDFILYHQNDKKSYNYFPSLNDYPDHILRDYEDYPFDIAFHYISEDLGGEVNANDFLNSSEGFGV
ncbi:MAG: 5'-nucleotidase C-terminal domain-containing protein [Bacilli bacterium]|nr:5'-nucleotidase C-terminal domain-containing protein [Bacilli bacterium]